MEPVDFQKSTIPMFSHVPFHGNLKGPPPPNATPPKKSGPIKGQGWLNSP